MNRGNRKKRIFNDEDDFRLFTQLLGAATDRFAMRLLAYCVMPNHFHLVVWPSAGDAISAYMRWLTGTHAQHYHRAHDLTGTGHLYQDRYRSVPVESDFHLLTVLRYVEANPLRAGLVSRAEHWQWSSLSEGTRRSGPTLTDSPIVRPLDWLDRVNAPDESLERLRHSVSTGVPYGTQKWSVEVMTP